MTNLEAYKIAVELERYSKDLAYRFLRELLYYNLYGSLEKDSEVMRGLIERRGS